MRQNLVFIALLVLVLTSCRRYTGWVILNPVPADRQDEVIVLTRNEVAAKLAIPAEELPVFSINGRMLPSQADDLNGDGKWDEVAILLDITASAAPKMIISFIEKARYPVFPPGTAREPRIFQYDSTSNCPGRIALLYKDSLYRPGHTDNYVYRKITDGPVRTVFRHIIKGWKIINLSLDAEEQISVYPGKYWVESKVTIRGLPQGAQIVAGFVSPALKGEPFTFRADSFICTGTYERQPEDMNGHGMAVWVPRAMSGKTGSMTDTDFSGKSSGKEKKKNNHNIVCRYNYISQEAADGQPSSYWFSFVSGPGNGPWNTEESFRQYLTGEMYKRAHPLVIKRLKGQE